MEKSQKIKCVLVGDDDIGKTSLLITYNSNKFPSNYVPSVLDDFAVNIKINNTTYTLHLVDTANDIDFDYHLFNADIFILCFSLAALATYQSAVNHWILKLKKINSKANILLVGLKSDLVNSEISDNINKIMTKRGINRYVICSAKTLDGVNNVFNEAVLLCTSQNKTFCDKIISLFFSVLNLLKRE